MFGSVAVTAILLTIVHSGITANTAEEGKMTKEDIEYWSHEIYLCSGIGFSLYGRDATGKININSSLCYQYYEGNKPLNTYDMSRLSGHMPMNRFLSQACCYEPEDELTRHGCPRWEAVLFCDFEMYKKFKAKAIQDKISAISTMTTTTQGLEESIFDKVINVLKGVDEICKPLSGQYCFQLSINRYYF